MPHELTDILAKSDPGDYIKPIFAAIVVIFWIIGGIVAAANKSAEEKKRRQLAARQSAAGRPPQPFPANYPPPVPPQQQQQQRKRQKKKQRVAPPIAQQVQAPQPATTLAQRRVADPAPTADLNQGKPTAPVAAANQIGRLLRRPDSLRAAFILNEVMSPPLALRDAPGRSQGNG